MRAIEPPSYVTHLQASVPSVLFLVTVLRLALLVGLVATALSMLVIALVSPSATAANVVCTANAAEIILTMPIRPGYSK